MSLRTIGRLGLLVNLSEFHMEGVPVVTSVALPSDK
jgi:hypothetical protein